MNFLVRAAYDKMKLKRFFLESKTQDSLSSQIMEPSWAICTRVATLTVSDGLQCSFQEETFWARSLRTINCISEFL